MSARRVMAWGLFALFFALAPGLAFADELKIPALTGRVVDQAGILSSAEESKLAAKSKKLEGATTIQLVIVTLRSLQGRPIEEWGLTLGRSWGIGQRSKDNGILLIVAPNDRELRIEVGLGLEQVVTDSRAAAIIHNVIVPRFKAGNMTGGISAGIDAISDLVSGEEASVSIADGPIDFIRAHRDWIPWIIFGVWLLIVLIVRLTRVKRIREHFYADDPWISTGYNRHTGRSYISNSLYEDESGHGGSGGGFSGGGGGFGGGGASGRW